MRRTKIGTGTMCLLAAALAALLCAAATAPAADYYISTTGNDSTGDGSFGNPWASPSRGAAVMLTGDHATADTQLLVRDTAGFLPSGNLKLHKRREYGGDLLTTVAYSSKTDTSFNLVGTLGMDLLAASYGGGVHVHDSDILGGDGLEPGDNVILRGGTYANQRIRLGAEWYSSPLTYKSYTGEQAKLTMTDLQLNGPNAGWARGVVYTESQDWNEVAPHTYTEGVVIDGLELVADQNNASANSTVIDFRANWGLRITNTDITALGSAAADGWGFYSWRSRFLTIDNSTIWARHGGGVYMDGIVEDGADGQGELDISYTVLGGPLAGNGSGYTAETAIKRAATGIDIEADHLTIVGFVNNSVDMVPYVPVAVPPDPAPGVPTGWIKNSIIIDASNPALYQGSGDYNDIYNAATAYGAGWNGGGGAGANDLAVDPSFLISGFGQEDANRFDPNWLRYYNTSALATAGEGGTYLGAFAPIAEPDLPGDCTGDTWVGGADLTTIITNWGMTGATREDGDLSGDGTVSGPDYTEVITHWGEGVFPGEPGAIPEPATLALVLIGGLALLRKRS